MRKCDIPEALLRRLYLDRRLSIHAIGEQLGVSGTTINERLKDYNIPRRGARKRITADIPRLHFEEKLSVKEIAGQLGVARGTVVKRLQESRLRQRTQSESMKVRMETMSPEERKLNASAANESRRGQIDSDERVASRLIGRQGKPFSSLEVMVKSFLEESGITGLLYNQLVGRYLVDLCDRSRKLAIEVDGGHWHSSPAKAKKDARKESFLRNEGWAVFRIRDPNAPKLRALLKKLRELPMPAAPQEIMPRSRSNNPAI